MGRQETRVIGKQSPSPARSGGFTSELSSGFWWFASGFTMVAGGEDKGEERGGVHRS